MGQGVLPSLLLSTSTALAAAGIQVLRSEHGAGKTPPAIKSVVYPGLPTYPVTGCVWGRQIIQIALLSPLMQFLSFALFHPFAPDHLSAQDGESLCGHVHTETLVVLLVSAVDIN